MLTQQVINTSTVSLQANLYFLQDESGHTSSCNIHATVIRNPDLTILNYKSVGESKVKVATSFSAITHIQGT